MIERLSTYLRKHLPKLSARADKGSKVAAIKLFCLECTGGEPKEARNCAVKDCALWGTVWKKERQAGG